MNIKNTRFITIAVLTFVILFAMNYIGSDLPDRAARALLTAVAGVAGLTIGLYLLYKNKNDDSTPPDFD